MHSLLIGNGLNRLALQLTWTELLKQLAVQDSLPAFADAERKPFSLFFEQLCAGIPGNFRKVEHQVKRKIAGILKNIPPDTLHEQFTEPFKVIMTTNYDLTLEHAIGGPLFRSDCFFNESRYSIFRRNIVAAKEVWHIHGDVMFPESIVLGYDHYAGYLQKIRNYLTSGISLPKDRIVRSPLKSGIRDFELWKHTYSWVDHFLRDHLHIVGLGLDFTEIDLWWLLLHKRRRDNKTGNTFFYFVHIFPISSDEEAKLDLLKSLGIQVSKVETNNYRSGYEEVLVLMKRNVAAYPDFLPQSSTRCGSYNASGVDFVRSKRTASEQLKLSFSKKR